VLHPVRKLRADSSAERRVIRHTISCKKLVTICPDNAGIEYALDSKVVLRCTHQLLFRLKRFDDEPGSPVYHQAR
jgi:hypothetical protein